MKMSKIFNYRFAEKGIEDGAIHEVDDSLFWFPGDKTTFQINDGQRIGGWSFERFGADINRAREQEKLWIQKAQYWLDNDVPMLLEKYCGAGKYIFSPQSVSPYDHTDWTQPKDIKDEKSFINMVVYTHDLTPIKVSHDQ